LLALDLTTPAPVCSLPSLHDALPICTLAECIHAEFARIQFTLDLMPADIVGTNVIIEDDRGGKHFDFQRGPIFANIVLADEINRDRKSTRLNSSHVKISYAVFCLKKK